MAPRTPNTVSSNRHINRSNYMSSYHTYRSTQSTEKERCHPNLLRKDNVSKSKSLPVPYTHDVLSLVPDACSQYRQGITSYNNKPSSFPIDNSHHLPTDGDGFINAHLSSCSRFPNKHQAHIRADEVDKIATAALLNDEEYINTSYTCGKYRSDSADNKNKLLGTIATRGTQEFTVESDPKIYIDNNKNINNSIYDNNNIKYKVNKLETNYNFPTDTAEEFGCDGFGSLSAITLPPELRGLTNDSGRGDVHHPQYNNNNNINATGRKSRQKKPKCSSATTSCDEITQALIEVVASPYYLNTNNTDDNLSLPRTSQNPALRRFTVKPLWTVIGTYKALQGTIIDARCGTALTWLQRNPAGSYQRIVVPYRCITAVQLNRSDMISSSDNAHLPARNNNINDDLVSSSSYFSKDKLSLSRMTAKGNSTHAGQHIVSHCQHAVVVTTKDMRPTKVLFGFGSSIVAVNFRMMLNAAVDAAQSCKI